MCIQNQIEINLNAIYFDNLMWLFFFSFLHSWIRPNDVRFILSGLYERGVSTLMRNATNKAQQVVGLKHHIKGSIPCHCKLA